MRALPKTVLTAITSLSIALVLSVVSAPSASAVAPSAPTGFAAASTPGSSTIDLSWTNPGGNFSYVKVERNLNAGGWSQVTAPGWAASTFADTGLSDGTYEYRITAFSAQNEPSSTVSLGSTVLIDTVPPMAPSLDAQGSNGSSTVALSWTIPNATGWPITGFVLESQLDGGTWTALATPTVSTTTYSATSLSDGSWVFRISAVTAGGNSNYGMSSAVVVMATPPAAPTDFVAASTPGSTSITLNWTNPPTRFDHAALERSLDGGGWSVVSSNLTGVSYLDPGLSDGTFQYRLTAYNPQNVASTSVQLSAGVLIDTVPPAAPTLTAQGVTGSSMVALSWTIPSVTGWPVTGFVLESQRDGGSWSALATPGASDTSTSATGLADGSWTFRISAVTAGGNSNYGLSNAVVVSTPPAPVPAPNPSSSTSSTVTVDGHHAGSDTGSSQVPTIDTPIPVTAAAPQRVTVPGLVVSPNRTGARVVRATAPAGMTRATAPVVSARTNERVAAAVAGLPTHAVMDVAITGPVKAGAARVWQQIGTVRSGARGGAYLPALRLSRAGTYLVRLTPAGASPYFVAVEVDRTA